MPTVTLMRGLPASGKTTIARAMLEQSGGRTRRVNLDELRAMAEGPSAARHAGLDAEETVLAVQDAAILANIEAGFDVVVDNTNIVARIPKRIARVLLGRARIEVIDLTEVPVAECIRRDALRPDPVGQEAILRMAARLASVRKSGVRLTAEALNTYPCPRPYVPDLSLRRAVICDLDGTLALRTGRDPYDLGRVEEDVPNVFVLELLRLFRGAGVAAVLLSGRERGEGDRHRAATERWLARLGDPYDELHQREHGDARPDDVVKLELFDRHVRDRFNVIGTVDDRDRLVWLWRRGLKLPCLQADYGAF